jgi:hypothetical protein
MPFASATVAAARKGEQGERPRKRKESQLNDVSMLQRLVDLEDIRRLEAQRIRAIDTQDWAAYEAVHAPEHYSHNDGEPRWDGAKANTDRLAALFQGVQTVHHVHTAELELTSPTTASGIWAMEDYLYWKQGGADHWLHGFGFYHETYRKEGDAWLFTSRRLRRTRVMTSPGARLGEHDRPT